MRRILFLVIVCFSVLSMLVSCNRNGGGSNEGRSYIIKGTVSLDSSMVVDNKLVLFTDNHRSLSQDTVFLSKDGTFEHEGRTNSLDELYLCGEQGELCRFYASGDMEVNLSLTTSEDSVIVKYLRPQDDSINGWLQEKKSLFDAQSASIRRLIMDSLIHNNPADVRVTLLLRDMMISFEDSLYIRQSLGSLTDNAKPDWMKKSIDNTLNVVGSGKKSSVNRRLQTATFELPDTIIDLNSSRSDYMLVCFWADYSRASIDSLRALANLIKTEYDHKRVSFMSCCLYSPDSAMWRVRSNFLEGSHTWIKGGFSDSRMRAWEIKQVPSVILMDMYCNQTQRDVWGAELRRALDRLPNRVGYQKK